LKPRCRNTGCMRLSRTQQKTCPRGTVGKPWSPADENICASRSQKSGGTRTRTERGAMEPGRHSTQSVHRTKLWSSQGLQGAAPLSWLVLLSILPLAHTEQLVAPASEYEPSIVYKTRSLDKHQKSEKYRLNRGCTPQQVQQRIDLQAKMSCSVQQET
jgi:hypothetical protein